MPILQRILPAVCLLVIALPSIAVAQQKVDRFGDPLPRGAVARLGTTRFRPAGDVVALAVSPDGKTLASAGPREVGLWELATGKKVAAFLGDREPFLLAFADQGKTLITVGDAGVVRYRDVAGGKIAHEFSVVKNAKGWENFGAITRDGRFLAFAEPGETGSLCVWDLGQRKAVKRVKSAGYVFGPIALSRDGKLLAAGSEQIEIWDLASGELKSTLTYKPPFPRRLAFSPDARTLVTSAALLHGTRLWNVGTGQEIKLIGYPANESCEIAFSEDGKRLAILNDDKDVSVRVWSMEAADKGILEPTRLLHRWKMEALNIQALLFTPDGKTLISAGDEAVIRQWDVTKGETRDLLGAESGPCKLVSSLDGRWLASSSLTGRIQLWNVKARTLVAQFADSSAYGLAAFSPGGDRLAYARNDRTVAVRDAATGEAVFLCEGLEKDVTALAFDLAGQALYICGTDLKVHVRRVTDGKETAHYDLEEPGTVADDREQIRFDHAFSRDGRLLLTMFPRDEPYRVWDMAVGRRRAATALPAAAGGNRHVFSPDGRLFATLGRGDALVIHEVASCKARLILRRPNFDSSGIWFGVYPAFSPDGRVLAVSNDEDKTIDLWDLVSGRRFHTMEAVQGKLTGLTFIGDLLATAGRDTTILLWDISEPRQKLRLPARTIGKEEIAKIWKQLDSDDPHDAMWKLVAGGDASVELLRQHLRPTDEPSAADVARWLSELNDDKFAVRAQADRNLERWGHEIEADLREFLSKNPPEEARSRVEKLLEKIELSRTSVPRQRVRELRALEVLEHLGSRPARALLTELTQKMSRAWMIREGRATLERLKAREGPRGRIRENAE